MLTFTPDNRALNGMPGCGICGIQGQVLSPLLDDDGLPVVIEVDPGVFYEQMVNDYDTAAAEVTEHIETVHLHPEPDPDAVG